MHRIVFSCISITLFLASSVLYAAGKIEICHLPPGNPDNWHTINISEKALNAHFNHGDMEGDCLGVCDALCDDVDACTQDVLDDLDNCICRAEPRPPVNCDDGNVCTADDCDSLEGCVYDYEILNYTACDDGDPNTINDRCFDGVCEGELGSCGGSPYLVHVNGLGQTWEDCIPLYTYDQTQAVKACEAYAGAGSCFLYSGSCSGDSVICGTGPGNNCACWGYEGAIPGKLFDHPSDKGCFCPTPSDLTWY